MRVFVGAMLLWTGPLGPVLEHPVVFGGAYSTLAHARVLAFSWTVDPGQAVV